MQENVTTTAVIIPASNEERLIGACLSALAASAPVAGVVEVIVIANGCRDGTVAAATAAGAAIRARGWAFRIIDRSEGGKLAALEAGDAATGAAIRVYLDADVTVSPGLLPQIVAALDRPDPAYASGRTRITARGAVSRAYARFWAQVPFMARGVPGCGIFAVNAAGRARWKGWPAIISDDTFVRLSFSPAERQGVPAPYDWPIAEGFGNLVRVRRRQDRGVAQLQALYPALLRNDDKLPLGLGGLARLAARDPVGFAVYAGVALATKLTRSDDTWSRGR